MKPTRDVPAEPVKWEDNPLDWPRAAGHADLLVAAIELRKRRQRRRRMAGAVLATATAAVLAFTMWMPRSSGGRSEPSRCTVVAAAERRVLPDGSIVELNRDATLTVEFDGASTGPRVVRLTTGVAHFQVAKNAERPFIVHAAGAQFRAVGTAFSVGLNGPAVEMLVTEGRVAVETSDGAVDSRGSALVVDAGNQVVVDPAAPQKVAVSPAPAAVSQQKLAWRTPRLEFNDAPLREVVTLIHRYSSRRIIIDGDELARLQISGALRADNVGPLLQLLEATYHVKVEHRPDGTILLRSER